MCLTHKGLNPTLRLKQPMLSGADDRFPVRSSTDRFALADIVVLSCFQPKRLFTCAASPLANMFVLRSENENYSQTLTIITETNHICFFYTPGSSARAEYAPVGRSNKTDRRIGGVGGLVYSSGRRSQTNIKGEVLSGSFYYLHQVPHTKFAIFVVRRPTAAVVWPPPGRLMSFRSFFTTELRHRIRSFAANTSAAVYKT